MAEHEPAAVFKVVSYHILNALQIILFGGHFVLSEHVVIEFLTMFSRTNHDYFGNCHFKVAFHFSGLVLVDTEHRRKLCGIALASVPGVEHHFVVDLLADELVGFGLVLEVHRGNYTVDHLDSVVGGLDCSVFVKLHNRTLNESVGFNFLARNLCAETFAELLVLFCHHLVGHVYFVIRNNDVLVKLHVEFGSEGKFILESKVLLILEVKFDNLHGNGLSKNPKLIFLDIFNYCIINFIVYDIAGHMLAEATVKFTERHVTLTESGDSAGASDGLKFFLNLLLVVVFFDRHCQHGADIAGLLH